MHIAIRINQNPSTNLRLITYLLITDHLEIFIQIKFRATIQSPLAEKIRYDFFPLMCVL
jgi:hypothetical protein